MSTTAAEPDPGDGELSDAERKLWDAAVDGRLADVTPAKADGDDTAQWIGWGQIRASLLTGLLTGILLPGGKQPRTVNLRGARITGSLDLEFATLTCPMLLEDCYLEEPVILQEATASAIRLHRCRLPGLIAQQLHATGDLDLQGVRPAGDVLKVTLAGAHIGGTLNLSGAKLAGAGGDALIADQITVGQSMVCQLFTANGEVMLTGARIGGQLNMTGAELSNPGGRALTAESVTVEHDMLCTDRFTAEGKNRFTAEGEVSLSGARIGGQLNMTGASLLANVGGKALNAEDLTVEHSMFCKDGFTASGEISLTAARIGGNLSMSDAKLVNRGHRALSAEGLTVRRNMFCRSKFTACGAIHLAVARINGELDLGDANLANPGGPALNLEAAQTARLTLPLHRKPDGVVNLTNAQVGELRDKPATWPAALHIRGFTYDTLGSEVSTHDRLGWLRRHQGGYVPQIYDQLAATYRRAGDEKAARTVAIAKQRRRRRAYSPLSWLWYLTVGYGYRPWLAGAWVIALAALGTAVFSRAYPAHMIAIRSSPPAFNPAAYALDLLLPVLGLAQKSVWQPQGAAYQYWSWALTGAGWVLTTAVVAGLTGILKRD